MYLSVSMQHELSLKFNRNNVYGHLEQVSRTCVYFHFKWLNWFCKLAPSAHIRYFCENSMIAHSALAMKDTFAPRFASIQWFLDSVEFLKNSEVILAKFQVLASRCYLLVNSLLCSESVMWTVSLMYNMSLVHLRIKPGQTCQHMHTGNPTKPLSPRE